MVNKPIKILFLLSLFIFFSISLNAAPMHYNDIQKYQSRWGTTDAQESALFDLNSTQGRGYGHGNVASRGRGRHNDCGRNCLPPVNDPGRVPAPVPEPLSLILFGSGMIGVGFLARKRARTHTR